ncbi:hypothetical protein [Methylobacterium frigidaeris]|uniref:Uncharacterized protein n=1 Tax=Methylobacterium frigidaeris TaxID=2038277 RepID=A0AA37HGK6_9HYPH|nr:hypothetical protein [Methylobacterium frigidaeris]PIK70528.1 hypothetical protein CS379_24160 [Methylobacterium frigidaeris]GJD65136.1 hypothetical protein MPEAHAMD_5323 [Methylobacterium frigidaeris]
MTSAASLRPHEIMALDFLDRNGPDAPGEVNSEEVMAAHLLFLDLKDRGLVSTTPGDDGPVYAITAAGKQALAVARAH